MSKRNQCSACGAKINTLGRAMDGTLHPGKACRERLAEILIAAAEAVVAQSNEGIDDTNRDDWDAAEITRPAIEALAAAVAKVKGQPRE